MGFGIRDGYQIRPTPDYFHDTQPDGKMWQPDVLPLAAHFARLFEVRGLVDIGCGRAEKLIPYASEFRITGIDYRDNIAYCQRQYKFGQWLDIDLEHETATLPINQLCDSVVVCADVIEHLANPECLQLTFQMMLRHAPLLIISTPDRQRTYGHDHNGPPGNPHHVREWTREELCAWLPSYGLHVGWSGWTRSNNIDTAYNTCLLLVTRGKWVYNTSYIETLFQVESA